MITNGCDFWFDGTWKTCCDIHDIAFQQEGSSITTWINANWELVQCIFPHSPLNAIIMGIGVFGFSWIVFNFKELKGKTIWEVITRKRYNGPKG